MKVMEEKENVLASPLILPRIQDEKGYWKAPRAYCVGMTDSGKSTLMEVLMNNYQRFYSTPKSLVRTLIVDTKPRFKADLELNGLRTGQTGRYRKWQYGADVIPGSYLLPRYTSAKSELDNVWNLGGSVAIVQAERKEEWGDLIDYVREFYEAYGAKYPRLIVVDELADFYERRTLTDIFQRVARNGRERDCALIAGSQRPRKVPVEIMTEMLRLYLFQLEFWEDIKHIAQFGIPQDVQMPQGHTFYLWDRKMRFNNPSNMYYELDFGR